MWESFVGYRKGVVETLFELCRELGSEVFAVGLICGLFPLFCMGMNVHYDVMSVYESMIGTDFNSE